MLTRNVPPAEMRADAERQLQLNPDDNLAALRYLSAHAAADRDDAFNAGLIADANDHDRRATRLHKAAEELASLRERFAEAQRVLSRRDDQVSSQR